MNDPVVCVIKAWWHNSLSLYLFLPLLLFFPVLPVFVHCRMTGYVRVCVFSICLLSTQMEKVYSFLCLCVCVRERENVCVVWLRVICTSPWHCHRFLSTVTSCLSRFSLSSSNTHTPTIPSSLYSSLQLCSIYTSIHPSVRTARPQPVSFINHQHWEGTREQSDELEEIEKGGRNDKCKRLEVKDETWT